MGFRDHHRHHGREAVCLRFHGAPKIGGPPCFASQNIQDHSESYSLSSERSETSLVFNETAQYANPIVPIEIPIK